MQVITVRAIAEFVGGERKYAADITGLKGSLNGIYSIFFRKFILYFLSRNVQKCRIVLQNQVNRYKKLDTGQPTHRLLPWTLDSPHSVYSPGHWTAHPPSTPLSPRLPAPRPLRLILLYLSQIFFIFIWGSVENRGAQFFSLGFLQRIIIIIISWAHSNITTISDTYTNWLIDH